MPATLLAAPEPSLEELATDAFVAEMEYEGALRSGANAFVLGDLDAAMLHTRTRYERALVLTNLNR